VHEAAGHGLLLNLVFKAACDHYLVDDVDVLGLVDCHVAHLVDVVEFEPPGVARLLEEGRVECDPLRSVAGVQQPGAGHVEQLVHKLDHDGVFGLNLERQTHLLDVDQFHVPRGHLSHLLLQVGLHAHHSIHVPRQLFQIDVYVTRFLHLICLF